MTDRQSVIDALTKPFPREAIKELKGRPYVSGTTVIYRLNEATNYDWEFEITGHELVGGAESQGNKPAQVVYGRMRIPIVSSGWRADLGTQALENMPDDHEAYKGAATDCLKRCARQFGVGLHLWGPDIEAGEIGNRGRVDQPRQQVARPQQARTVNQIAGGGTIAPGVGMTDNQRKAIWAIAKNELNWTDADVEQLSMQVFGVELKALDKQQASGMIENMKAMQGGELATHPKVQQAIDNREANWLAAIEGAATMGELQRIGAQIAEAGVKEGPLRVAYANRRDRLQEKALV